MAATSAIEWTDATWNPWMGCARVSPGCAHCYMFSEQRRYGHDPEVVRRSKTRFFDPLRWREPRRVFTCSWSDWFIPSADRWRDEAWEVVRRSPHLTFQILTKRPELVADRLPAGWGAGWPNVWLGTSIENRRFVDRADVLRAIPAAIRFISAEPLLGPLDGLSLEGIGWVIAGGESGARCRSCDPVWLRSLRDRCLAAGVPFFLKQLGGWPDKRGRDRALLDGQLWRDMPRWEGKQ
jgi:protein gp37